MCHISNEIAKHCNEEERFCPKCEAIMYFDDFHPEVLVCSDTECSHEIDTDEEL